MNSRVRKIVLVLSLMLFVEHVWAGITTDLLNRNSGGCHITIEHDRVTESETGTVLFRHVQNESAAACHLREATVTNTLQSAFEVLSHRELKPVTSIFIRRLVRYPWIVNWLQEQANAASQPGRGASALSDWLMDSTVLKPFKDGVALHGYTITSVSCEKRLVDEQGAVTDALCWLVIRQN